MITPIDSADTLGPNQLSKRHQRHQEAQRIFFAHSKLKHNVFLKALFDAKRATFHHFWRNILENVKNRLPIDVCARQNLLRYRMITSNTLLDTLLLAQHFTNLSRVRMMHETHGNGNFVWNFIFKNHPKWQFLLQNGSFWMIFEHKISHKTAISVRFMHHSTTR